MAKTQTHEWHENRPAEEGRGKRYFRAHWTTRGWHFTTTVREDPDWNPIEQPDAELYQALRDILWRKYQRRRVPIRLVEDVDARLKEFGVTPMDNFE
ncbi:MAG: hypothetical protein KDK99_16540 [Verrucomicrobiales bacterium]|nr:hypothetical protein [Verrucomicrobiales bacterium]